MARSRKRSKVGGNPVIIPPALSSPSEIRVIAPSGPFDATLFWVSVGWLAQHHRVTFDRSLLNRDGFFAGSDDRRRHELQAALDDPLVSAIVAARGGWGTGRIVDSIDFAGFKRNPKWIVGFSDITTLHAYAWQHGVASLHAANLVSLGQANFCARSQWLQTLAQPCASMKLSGAPLVAGKGRGILVGGNLTVLISLLSRPTFRLPAPCILAIEDVAESSYRIDRLLDSLVNSSALGCIAGLALGQFTECGPGKHRVPVDRVLADWCRRLAVPTVCGLPFGHAEPNHPLVFGASAVVDGTSGELWIDP